MRLLMLDNEFPPLGGGMGTTNQALFRQFAPCVDLEIDLITAALGHKREYVDFSERIHIYKVPVQNQNLHHSSNRELIAYTLQALPLALKLHRQRPYDFCFAWSALPAGAIARALQWRTGLPYMVWVSGPDIPGFEERYRWMFPFLMPMLRTTWCNATPLIAKCQQEIEMLHAADSTLKITCVPNGVDIDVFHPGTPIPDEGALNIICVARLIERKGQHHLIQAVKRLADEQIAVTLDLVGTGDALETYQTLARELGVAERVRFVGYVPREEIPNYYRAAHVFVLPSFNEGLALAGLEALATGLPLILTRTGGTDDLVEEGLNGFTFDWGDVAALTAHLRCLATNRTLARQMGQASRQRAQRFAWEAIAAQYLELFHRCERRK